jgi:predicted TPR repeat methyltransferase
MIDYFERACACIRRGEFLQAEALLLRLISADAQHFDANHMLGIVCSELQKLGQAESYFLKALSIDNKYPPLFQNYGLFLSKTKQFDKAIIQFNAALQLFPKFAVVYSDRGSALRELKKFDEAIADFNQAIQLAPHVPGFYHNRANALRGKKSFVEALRDYDYAIKLDPQYSQAFCGRGNVLFDVRRFDEALAAYDKALMLKPDLAEAWLGQGAALSALKRHDEASAAYDKAITLKSDLAEAWLGRGLLKVIRGNVKEGQKDCEQAISFGADKETVYFNLARYLPAANIVSVPRKIVEDEFDGFASYFDSFLLDALKYDAPAKLFNLVRQHIKISNLDVLDLGCGTGLLGIPLRSIARTLIGVDLSYRMLDKAKDRAIYDGLQCKDILEFMNNDIGHYDLVASTDVFIYFGDLSEIFGSIKRRLKTYGWFAFSVEATNKQDYVFTEAGRFQHSKAYLERLALINEFKIIAIEDSTLREEDKKEVPGFLALLSRA